MSVRIRRDRESGRSHYFTKNLYCTGELMSGLVLDEHGVVHAVEPYGERPNDCDPHRRGMQPGDQITMVNGIRWIEIGRKYLELLGVREFWKNNLRAYDCVVRDKLAPLAAVLWWVQAYAQYDMAANRSFDARVENYYRWITLASSDMKRESMMPNKFNLDDPMTTRKIV